MRSTFTDNLFATTLSKDSQFIQELNLQTKEAEAEQKRVEKVSNKDNSSTTVSTTSSVMPSTTTEATIQIYEINAIKNNESEVVNEVSKSRNDLDMETESTNKESKTENEIDFTKASTLEIPNSRSTEEDKSSSEEQVTDEPEKTGISREADESVRGDMIFTMSTSRESLESMSILKDIKGKEADINEDWTDSDGSVASTLSTFVLSTNEPTVTTTIKMNEEKQESTTNVIIVQSKTLLETSTERILPKENKVDNKDLEETSTIKNISKGNMVQKDVPETTTEQKPNDLESKSIPDEETVHLSTLISDNDNNTVTTHSPELESKDILIDLPDAGSTPTLHINVENLTTSSPLAKNLLDLEEKTELMNKIKEIVQSQLQPAKVRNKHRLLDTFECRR